jgi:hypothetical protein
MLISRANCLTKLLLNRSNLLSKTVLASFSSNNPILLKTSSNSSPFRNQLCLIGVNKFHTNSIFKQKDDTTTKKTSILDTPVSAKQSILTDDLVKNYTASEKSDANSQENVKQPPESNTTQGQTNQNENSSSWSKWFSREHGWKVSLGFIFLLTGGSVVYFLTSFGPEKLDENNQPVKSRPFIETFFNKISH